MADVDHPKTHVEDQDLDGLRRQPESPKHEGIDPLTESDTMLPREDVKGNAEKLAKKEAKAVRDTEADEKVAQTVRDQEELNARAATPNSKLDDEDKTQTTAEKEKTADADTTDKETGEENTSPSNKTTPTTSQDDVKAAEKPADSETPKSGTAGSKTSQR